MKLDSISITNYSFNCNKCKSTTTIKYETISGNIFCDKCIINSNIFKYKPYYTPIYIGDYSKLTFREFNFSEKIIQSQLNNIPLKK